MNDILFFSDNISFIPFNNESLDPSELFMNFTIGDTKGFISIEITGREIHSIFEHMDYMSKKRTLIANFSCVAINNLIKKNEFLQLSLQFAENHISLEEYNLEIEQNSHKYIVNADKEPEDIDVYAVGEILSCVEKKDLTTDEVAEMFSINNKSLNKKLVQLNLYTHH